MKNTFVFKKMYLIKIKYVFMVMLFSVFALPAIIILRFIGPLFKLRLGEAKLSRMGHIYDIIFYLSEKSKNVHKGFIDLFYIETTYHEPIYCNNFVLKLWKRKIKVIPFWYFGQSLKFFNKLIPFKRINDIPYLSFGKFRTFNEEVMSKDSKRSNGYNGESKYKIYVNNNEPLIPLTENEINKGYKNLEKFNISRKDKFICFANRDSNYLNTLKKNITTLKINFEYHNYRNSNIQDYIFAAEELTKKGYFLIRTGKFTNSSFIKKNGKIIDYSKSDLQSDFMDFFLGKKCEFYICPDSGISAIPESFRTPIVFANTPGIQNMPAHNTRGIIIFKKIYCSIRNRLLKFKEIMEIENETIHIGGRKFIEKYKNFKIIDSSPEEINDAAQEMDKLLNNQWDCSFFNQNLQAKFWDIARSKNYNNLKSKKLLVSNSFLEKHRDLL